MTAEDIIKYTTETMAFSGLKPSDKAEKYIRTRYKIDDPKGENGGFTDFWKTTSLEDMRKLKRH